MNWIPMLARPKPVGHPGYFKVVIGLIFAHLGIGSTVLLVPSDSVAFAVIMRMLFGSLVPLMVMHVLVSALMVFGLYGRRAFWMVRFGSALSVVTFNLMAAGFVVAALQVPPRAGIGPTTLAILAILAITASLSSLAAAQEPWEGGR